MDRRCTGSECLIMAGAKMVSLDLPVATILASPRNDWNMLTAGHGRVRVAREIEVDWKKYNQDNYLFSHCTIVASVAVEDDGYSIVPACLDLVNNNGNAWSNPVLLATFKTFVGGENYLEHVQVPELSKGKLLDAVLRPVKFKDKKGREADIFYCDILVATAKKHSDLVKKIASGELSTMSMGCLADYVQCSKCGKVLGDNEPNCTHLDNEMLQRYVDKKGKERIVSELCGRCFKKNGKWEGDPKSVKFIEASWVARPAFYGAVLNHHIGDISKEAAQMLTYPTFKLAETVDELFKMRVADRAGMIMLRVARAEMIRRSREDRIGRIVQSII